MRYSPIGANPNRLREGKGFITNPDSGIQRRVHGGLGTAKDMEEMKDQQTIGEMKG